MEPKCGMKVSHERIYQYKGMDKKNGGILYKNLRHSGKRYNKRGDKSSGKGIIPNRIGIEKRPRVVDVKVRVGDFEIDTIVFITMKDSLSLNYKTPVTFYQKGV